MALPDAVLRGERAYRKSVIAGLLTLVIGIVALAVAGWIARGFFAPHIEWTNTCAWLLVALAFAALAIRNGVDAMRDREPVLTIGERGVLTRDFGLVPWSEVASARVFEAKGTRLIITLREPFGFARQRRATLLTTDIRIDFDFISPSANDAAALVSARAGAEKQASPD